MFVTKPVKSTAMDDEDEAENEVAGGDSEEAMEFATSYAEEKSLGLSKEVLRHVSSIPAEAGKGKTAHFAQLSSLLDQISQAVKSAKLSVESLLKTKYKSLAELKEKIADDTKKYFKKEVEKEHRQQQANKQPASSKPTKAVSDNQVANAIRGFAQMASTNPGVLSTSLLWLIPFTAKMKLPQKKLGQPWRERFKFRLKKMQYETLYWA